ncbi:histidinol-phosphatase [Patescibacteria group bacterium]|nr:histidinol-phosphatase [Patescibacteria group bacterium]
MITNGSDQGIDIIFRIFTEKDDKVIIPSPSFAMFYQCAQVVGNKILIPLYRENDLSFPLKEVLAAIDNQVKLIVVCNPNNPTGTAISVDNIEKIAKKAKNAIIYVDEAYFEFSKISAITLIKKYPNIIITRTFSKAFGLASLRIGYVIARKEYITEMLKVRGPYDVNMAAYQAASTALTDRKTMENYVNEVMEKAKPLVEKFFFEKGVPYYSSAANFILFRPNHVDYIWQSLKKIGFLLRPQNKQNIKNTLRVSIGTVKQMKKFIAAYENVILKKIRQKYAFLDRDGTLIFEPQDTYQIDSLEKLKILNGVIRGLKELKRKGYKFAMISNQDGLGTQSFPQKDFEIPQEKMLSLFRKAGINFDHIFICPHLPKDKCNCRKPKTGLVDKFLKDNAIDKKLSFVCGDRESDRQFAINIGIKHLPMQTNGNFYSAIKLLSTHL